MYFHGKMLLTTPGLETGKLIYSEHVPSENKFHIHIATHLKTYFFRAKHIMTNIHWFMAWNPDIILFVLFEIICSIRLDLLDFRKL